MSNPSQQKKQGSCWYPQFTRRSRNPRVAHDHDWRPEMEANPGEDRAPQQQPRKRTASRAHGELTSWEHCFNNNCKKHWWEKVDTGYYPRQVGEKGTLSRNDRREQKKRKVVRTRLGGQGSEKTIPDMDTVEKTIWDLATSNCAAQTIVAKDKDLERLDKEKEKLPLAYNRTKQRMRRIRGMPWKAEVYHCGTDARG